MSSKVWTREEIEHELTVKGLSRQEAASLYVDISTVYDELYGDTSRCLALCKHVTRLLPNKECRILDIGAGTGVMCTALRKYGYSNIDALDPCEQMLAKAKEKKIYTNIYHEYIGAQETSIPAGIFDAVIAVGVFVDGHITQEAFPEIIRLLKVGGYFLTDMRVMNYPDIIEEEMTRLHREGYWLYLLKQFQPHYFDGETGYTYILQKIMKKYN